MQAMRTGPSCAKAILGPTARAPTPAAIFLRDERLLESYDMRNLLVLLRQSDGSPSGFVFLDRRGIAYASGQGTARAPRREPGKEFSTPNCGGRDGPHEDRQPLPACQVRRSQPVYHRRAHP